MKYRVRHTRILREWVLLLFALSALSPVYVTIMWDKGSRIEQSSPGKTELRMGISWLRNFFTVVTDTDPDVDCDGRPDGYQILVGGGLHAVSRGTVRIKPVIEQRLLPVNTAVALFTSDYQPNIPIDAPPHERQGYPSLTTGLSPPNLLS